MKKLLFTISIVLSMHLILFAQSPTKPESDSKPADSGEWKPKTEVQFQYSQENLTRNYGTWRTASLNIQQKFENRQAIWATYRVSSRNTYRDKEIVVGTYKPLPRKWAVTAEAMYSPTYKYVGKYSLLGEVEKVVKRNYVIHGGIRFTAYSQIKATSVYGLAERYWGSNRAAYTLSLTNLTNAGTSPSHRIQYNRYFGDKVHSIGTTFAFGKEHENLGPNLGVLRTRTWSVAGSGKYWVNERFGLNVTGSFHRQGNLYSRSGIHFGALYRF